MIKNIVFDMGQVMTYYDGERVCRHFMEDPQEIKEVFTSVFVSPEWLLLDMGIIEDEEAVRRMSSRVSTDHARKMVRLCMEHWHEYCMWPKEGMGELVRELKERGFSIYLCSNAAIRLVDCYRDVIPGWEHFDGILFSASVKCMKPQKEIYLHLFEQFSLVPQECFFVDDLQLNIDGGRACGMDGCCFQDGDVDRLRQVLFSLRQ